MSTTAAIYSALANDATLTGSLGTYNSLPAIFSADPAPADWDQSGAWIILQPAVTQEPADTLSKAGRDVVRNIRIYTKWTGSAQPIEAVAERVRTILHNADLGVSGAVTLRCAVSGPSASPTTAADVEGRLLQLRLTIQET